MLFQVSEAARSADLVLVVGTSAHVAPASDVPVLASNSGVKVIELNLQTTQLTNNHVSDMYALGRAEELVPEVVRLVRKLMGLPEVDDEVVLAQMAEDQVCVCVCAGLFMCVCVQWIDG